MTIPNVIHMPDPLEQIGEQIAVAYDQTQRGRNDWREGTLTLAQALAAARDEFDSNADFSAWLADNGCDRIGDHDRAALIKMASDDAIETTRTVLSETTRTSWQHIWDKEIKPRLAHVSKKAPGKANYVVALKRFDATMTAAIDGVDELGPEAVAEISDLIEKIEAGLKLLREKMEAAS